MSSLRLALCLLGAGGAAFGGMPHATPTADEALATLRAGNARFVAGAASHPDQSPGHRESLAGGQAPIAIVLACADSRVAPELVFDQGVGTLFVIRNAGNVIDDHVLGSIEYAVEHLQVSLIVVMGHAKCGAVAAAVAGGELPGHLPSIVNSIAPAVAAAAGAHGDRTDAVVRANARRVAEQIAGSHPLLAEAVAHGRAKVVAGRYDLATGRFETL